jgi:tetratricopeptide (TPR) repeat protein
MTTSRWPAAEAITHFARAMGSLRSGNATNGRKDVEKLQSLQEALVKAKDKYWAEQVEIQRRAASAWLVRAEGNKEEALKLMRAAADLEEASGKHVAMENRLWPMRELLGELLLDLNEPAKALKEFEAALQVAPNRFRGFYGAARAAELSGDREKAKIFYEKLVEVCIKAEIERPELQQAKAFLSKK